MKRPAIIVDLDGTLCNTEHRMHFIRSDKPDWVGFQNAMEDDECVPAVAAIVRWASSMGLRVLPVTMRREMYRLKTTRWFAQYELPHHRIYMAYNDDRLDSDALVKERIYREDIAPAYDVLFAIEDRPDVVAMWHGLGVTCFAVNQGAWAQQMKYAGARSVMEKLSDYYGSQAESSMAVRIAKEVAAEYWP